MGRCLRSQISRKTIDSPVNQGPHLVYQICLCSKEVYPRNSNHPCRCQVNPNPNHDENTQANKDQRFPRVCVHHQASFRMGHLLTSLLWQCHRITGGSKWVVSSRFLHQEICMTRGMARLVARMACRARTDRWANEWQRWKFSAHESRVMDVRLILYVVSMKSHFFQIVTMVLMVVAS